MGKETQYSVSIKLKFVMKTDAMCIEHQKPYHSTIQINFHGSSSSTADYITGVYLHYPSCKGKKVNGLT